jgi:hypothetical protein
VTVVQALVGEILMEVIAAEVVAISQPNKAFKRTKNSWLFHSVHIIANNFLPLNVAL